MTVQGAKQRIEMAVEAWPGTDARPHRFGGTEFKLGRREIGHVHGDSLVDIPFPKQTRDELVAAGRCQPHHILPQSGWVSVHIRSDSDVDNAIDLLHISYELAEEHQAKAA